MSMLHGGKEEVQCSLVGSEREREREQKMERANGESAETFEFSLQSTGPVLHANDDRRLLATGQALPWQWDFGHARVHMTHAPDHVYARRP